MTVKDQVGRARYVAFAVVGGPVGRAAVGALLPPAAKLTRFDGTFGILRCVHRDLAAVQAVLNVPRRVGERDVTLQGLSTSGTIRAAAKALPATSEASRRSAPPRTGKAEPARPVRKID